MQCSLMIWLLAPVLKKFSTVNANSLSNYFMTGKKDQSKIYIILHKFVSSYLSAS